MDRLRLDNLLHPLFHPAQYERNPCGWYITTPKSRLDDTDCPEYYCGWGFLAPGQSLIHDRNGKFCVSFQKTLEGGGVRSITLPPRSPNLNAYVERWVKSVKEGCLSNVILFEERALRRAIAEYVEHYYQERNHQGRGNVLFFLLHDRDKSTIILFNVERGSVGCLNITTRRPHEFFTIRAPLDNKAKKCYYYCNC